jgi:hypothetical protein
MGVEAVADEVNASDDEPTILKFPTGERERPAKTMPSSPGRSI